MTAFTWLEGMSVGVEEFDNAHKTFFTLLNQIAEALDAAEPAKAEELCNKFLRLAVAHGEREAEFLRRNRYTGIALIEETQSGTQARINGLLAAVRDDPERAKLLVADMRAAVVAYLLRGDINFKSFVDDLGAGVVPLDQPPVV